MMHVTPVTLESALVRLEPLGLVHAEALLAAAQDESIWRYLLTPMPTSLADMHAIVTSALEGQTAGQMLPFATIERASNTPIGSTRYLNIEPANRGLEIGWTWLTPRVQRTGINTECKYLLLCHAFETLGALRVQLKTDSRNLNSQRAIERLGAIKEGVLRKVVILHNGYQRSSVFYSILDDEWPTVKAGLETKMAAGSARPADHGQPL
jgi:RimJ/RimL family protein N-acetyltransferase